jgi:3-hydroxy acid dehydrogenase/malonic semialdehyde reductase
VAQSLKDKTIFITGATSGFGEAFSKRFVGEGGKIIATGRRTERMQALQAELGTDKVHILTFDVREQKELEAAIASLPPTFGQIDILINNAGLALGLGPADEAELSNWEQMVDTNIKGVLYATHALLPQMVKQGHGHIVNIGSIAGTYPYPGGNVYGATKAFLKQFSLNLRADLIDKNIRVTNIEPGMVETEFSMVRFQGDENKAKAVYKNMQPLTAKDIAETVLFCLTCPPHVNINAVEIMPTTQAFSPFAVHRNTPNR